MSKQTERQIDRQRDRRADRVICLYVSCIFLHIQRAVPSYSLANEYVVRLFKRTYVLRVVEMTPFCRFVERSSPARFTYRNAPTTVAFQWRQLQWTVTHVGPPLPSLYAIETAKNTYEKRCLYCSRWQRSLFGFPNKLKAHFGPETSTRLASPGHGSVSTRLDDRLSIAVCVGFKWQRCNYNPALCAPIAQRSSRRVFCSLVYL